MDRMIRNQLHSDTNLNDSVPRFCQECVKYATCDLCHDEQLREQCPQFQDDVPLTYRNSEGYADPTTYYALRNVERERKTKGTSDRRKEQNENEQRKPRHNTQVVHY